MRLVILLAFYSCLFCPTNLYARFSQRSWLKDNPQSLKLSKAADYLDLAAFFKESGDYQQAKDILKKAKQFSNDADIKRYLGKLEFLSGNSKEAFSLFNSLRNKNWQDFLYLGLINEYLKDEDSAIDCYLKSTKLQTNSIALLRLGKIYRQKGSHKTAIKFFLRLIEFDSSIAVAYYYLGECLHQQDQYRQAYKFLLKAKNLYPENKEINKELILLKEKIGKDFFATAQISKERERRKAKFSSYRSEDNLPQIRIGLIQDLKEFSFSCSGGFVINDGQNSFEGKANKFYTLASDRRGLALSGYQESINYGYFSLPARITSLKSEGEKFPFQVLDVSYGKGSFWHKKVDRALRGDLEVIAKDKKIILVNHLSIEEYLYGVLAAEMPAKAHQQALYTQAVTARSLAFKHLGRHRKEGFDLCSDVHCQVYQGLSAETPETKKAVDATRGEILIYEKKPIEAFYHSNCGGCLSADTFGNFKYLESKIDAAKGKLPDSPYKEDQWFTTRPLTFSSESTSNFRWQRIYDQEDFRIAFGYALNEIKLIIPKDKGDCFHYKEIALITKDGNKSLPGDLKIRNYFDKLRSSAFKLELKLPSQEGEAMLVFWGAGFGHAAGLSQQGAMNMASEGYDYQKILEHYYPKAQIKKMY